MTGAVSSSARPYEFSLVIPSYNAGAALRHTVEGAARILAEQGIRFEIIVVSDGSTDGSERTLHDLLPGTLSVVTLSSNRGKGYAVRAGLARAQGSLVGFIDADGDISPDVLADLVASARSTAADVAYGSKRHSASEVRLPPVRRLGSWGYRLLVRALFDLSVRETQTGVKVIRREVLDAVLPHMAEDRFAFDVELFALAQFFGYRSFVEVPIRLAAGYRTTMSIGSVATVLLDTLKLSHRLRKGEGKFSAEYRGRAGPTAR